MKKTDDDGKAAAGKGGGEEEGEEQRESVVTIHEDSPPTDHVHAVKEVVTEEGEEGEPQKAPSPPRQKRAPKHRVRKDQVIHLIRHGQSEYNLHYAQHGTDPMIFDADLTPLGVQQAQSLQAHLSSLHITLAISSPLRRAMRTCLLSLPCKGENKKKLTYEVWPEPRELLEASCDLGEKSTKEMREEFSPPFSHIEKLPPVWWYISEDCDSTDPSQCRRIFKEQGYIEPYDVFKKRLDALAEKLKARPEKSIAIFGHGDFFHTFLREHMDVKGKWMENCEVVSGFLVE